MKSFLIMSLKFTELSHMPYLSASTLQIILQANPRITHLSLEKSQGAATDESLCILAKYCPAVKTLSLAYCKLLTDIGLMEVCSKCTALEELSLSHCNNISSTALQYLAQNCPRLTILTLESTIYTLDLILVIIM